jgi:hypothetical protein
MPVSIAGVSLRVSQITALLMAAGWIAVVYSALFMKGGHPPMSAFVGMIVIIGSWFAGTLGVIAALVSLVLNRTRRRSAAIVFASVNAGLLAFSVLVNFM